MYRVNKQNQCLVIRILAILVYLAVFFFIHSLTQSFAEDGLHVYFLDVGQGDSTVLVYDNETMMIDGGDSSYSQFIYSFLRNTLCIDHINVMIATHPHADHIGGLAAALNACQVDVLYTSEINYSSDTWQSVLKYAKKQGTPVLIPEAGDEFTIGKALVQILGPIWYHNNLNDMSLIIKVTYAGTSILFMGDAEIEAERDLLDADIDVSASILHVGHHGSDTSTSPQFLLQVSPTYGIISVGKDNTYGHPDAKTLTTLDEAGVIVMRTDLLSTIECLCDDDGVFFSFHRPP